MDEATSCGVECRRPMHSPCRDVAENESCCKRAPVDPVFESSHDIGRGFASHLYLFVTML